MVDQFQPPPPMRRTWLIVLAGIILPAVAIAVETLTHMCARSFFNPIPSFWHILLVFFVPLANIHVCRAIRAQQIERAPLLAATNAIAVGISLFYTLVYVQLFPIAVVAVIFFGLGLLPLAPLFALIAGLALRREVSRLATGTSPRSFWLKKRGLLAGVGIAFCFIAMAELPSTLTRIGLRMAVSENAEKRARGIRLLQKRGDRDALLRACYWRSGRAPDLFGNLLWLSDRITPAQGREIYYRVTGQTFDMAPPPGLLASGFADMNATDFEDATNSRSRIEQLSLHSSQMDGSADVDAGLTYLEWTLTFRNDSAYQNEARAQVQLPPGAVVSRVSLWRDGRWSEAAFAKRDRVKPVFGQILSQERNSLSVTTSGRDRVTVQCFPVQANGGLMKVRLGITAPLLMENAGYDRLLLPRFVERNFVIDDDLRHEVWIEANAQLESSNENLDSQWPLTGLHALRGKLADLDLSLPKSSIRFARSSISDAWTSSTIQGKEGIVRQTVRESTTTPVQRIMLVIDTSRTMQKPLADIVSAVERIPANVELQLLFTGGNGAYNEPANGTVAISQEIASLISNIEPVGGTDNVPALIKAWDLAEGGPANTAIVWIHSPQLMQLRNVDSLKQRLERRPNGPRLYSVETNAGADQVEQALDGASAMVSVPRLRDLESDLNRLFGSLTRLEKTYEYVRSNEVKDKTEESKDKSANPVRGNQTSGQLAKLWANDEINRLLATNEDKSEAEATELAMQYQLVTPVTTGAVVNESQKASLAGEMQPVSQGSVPMRSESPIVILTGIGVSILLLALTWHHWFRSGRRGITP